MTEKEKMLCGQPYAANDDALLAELNATKELVWQYNNLRPAATDERLNLLKQMLGACDDHVRINQPFYCDYGKHIRVGRNFFANFGFTVLDEAYVTIGDNCFVGPNVNIYTACHPTDPTARNNHEQWAKPV